MSARRITGVGLLLAVLLAFFDAGATATPIRQGTAMFKDTTYEELQPYAAADRLIAVVRCEAIATASPGSRSERQQIRASLVAGAEGQPQGSPLTFNRYAQGAPVMKVGTTYLVAAYRESTSGPWALLEHREVKPEAASSEYKAAAAEVSRRLDKAAPR